MASSGTNPLWNRSFDHNLLLFRDLFKNLHDVHFCSLSQLGIVSQEKLLVILKVSRNMIIYVGIIITALIACAQARHSHNLRRHDHASSHLNNLFDRSIVNNNTCATPASSVHGFYWLDQQSHIGVTGGYSPFLQDQTTYPVYRNVKSYKAVRNGQSDDTKSLQTAINDDGKGGNRYQNEVSTRPAQVFLPGGTYLLMEQLDLRLNTVLVGDPNDMPILKAAPDFQGTTVVNGYDYASHASGGTTNFFVAMKNIIIDTTEVDRNSNIIALQWGVAQGCQLSNLEIRMPTKSGGHTGIALDQGSTTAIADVVSLFKETIVWWSWLTWIENHWWRCWYSQFKSASSF